MPVEMREVTPRPVKSMIPDKALNKDAILLIQAINSNLDAGMQHYNSKGEKITALGDILQCLLDEDSMRVEMENAPVAAAAVAGD